MKTLVILGSARSDSNTLTVVKELCPFTEYELIDLRDMKIDLYSYEGPTGSDDFLEIIKLMELADNIIFATPVYWYAMSAVLKIFFDRLSDLLSSYKSIGKELKGKKTYLISTGADDRMPEGFEVPFRLTSDYFGMDFQRSYYKTIR